MLCYISYQLRIYFYFFKNERHVRMFCFCTDEMIYYLIQCNTCLFTDTDGQVM